MKQLLSTLRTFDALDWFGAFVMIGAFALAVFGAGYGIWILTR